MAFLSAVGSGAPWKTRYIRFGKDNLLAYKNKEDGKAKFCYAFKDCKVSQLPESEVAEESTREESKQPYSAKRHTSQGTGGEEMRRPAMMVVKIEHKELETLFLRVDNDEQMKMVHGITFANSFGHSSSFVTH